MTTPSVIAAPIAGIWLAYPALDGLMSEHLREDFARPESALNAEAERGRDVRRYAKRHAKRLRYLHKEPAEARAPDGAVYDVIIREPDAPTRRAEPPTPKPLDVLPTDVVNAADGWPVSE